MTKIKCTYSECKSGAGGAFTLPLTNEEGALVELTFCDYHLHIVMGGHFKAKGILVDGKLNDFELTGPLEQVEITEQVIAAIEMAKNSRVISENLKKKED